MRKPITDLKTVYGQLGLNESDMDAIGVELDDRDLSVVVHSNELRAIISEYVSMYDAVDKFDGLGLDGVISIEDLCPMSHLQRCVLSIEDKDERRFLALFEFTCPDCLDIGGAQVAIDEYICKWTDDNGYHSHSMPVFESDDAFMISRLFEIKAQDTFGHPVIKLELPVPTDGIASTLIKT